MTDKSELIKYLLPALGVFLTLLIPKVWDWWRESSKNKYESRKILKKSLFHLLRTFTILTECEYYLSVRGSKIDYGIYIFVDSMKEQNAADAFMSLIMKQYRQTLDQTKIDLVNVCNELAAVEPLIANRLSFLSIDPVHVTDEIKQKFKLPFLMGNVLSEIKKYRGEIELYCLELSSLLDRKTKKATSELISNSNSEMELRIEEHLKTNQLIDENKIEVNKDLEKN
jgi:hypothetical protein